MDDGEGVSRRIADGDIAGRFVILNGGIVVGLVSFDQVGFENDGGQIALDYLKNERLGLGQEMGRFGVGMATGLKVLGEPAFEVDGLTNV